MASAQNTIGRNLPRGSSTNNMGLISGAKRYRDGNMLAAGPNGRAINQQGEEVAGPRRMTTPTVPSVAAAPTAPSAPRTVTWGADPEPAAPAAPAATAPTSATPPGYQPTLGATPPQNVGSQGSSTPSQAYLDWWKVPIAFGPDGKPIFAPAPKPVYVQGIGFISSHDPRAAETVRNETKKANYLKYWSDPTRQQELRNRAQANAFAAAQRQISDWRARNPQPNINSKSYQSWFKKYSAAHTKFIEDAQKVWLSGVNGILLPAYDAYYNNPSYIDDKYYDMKF